MRATLAVAAWLVTISLGWTALVQEPVPARTYSGQKVLLYGDGTWKPDVEQLDPVRTVTLLSRAKYQDYEKATFSFVHGIRDDPELARTRNDWELLFGNGADVFDVDFNHDGRSRIVDLGKRQLDEIVEIPVLMPLEPKQRAPGVPARQGHVYVVHAKDDDTDLYALFRVEWLEPGDSCVLSWKVVPSPEP